MNSPLVSIIVPNYCHSRFLELRIDSILNQTYQDFELIFLDDCSPDNGASKAIIEKYRDNPHVSHIIYNEKNSGSTFMQWDKGINLAKGEFVWIAESDDYCVSTFLESLIKEFKNDDHLVLAYSLVQLVDGEGKPIHIIEYTPHGVKRLTGYNYIRKYMTLSNHCVNASACLFRKSAYSKITKNYMDYKACGDWVFWVEIASNGNVAIVNNRLSFFRRTKSGVTSASSKEGVEIVEKIMVTNYLFENFDISKRTRNLMKYNIKYLYEEKKSVVNNKNISDIVESFLGNIRWSKMSYIKMRIINTIRPKFSLYL